MADKYAFLSDEWFAAVQAIVTEHGEGAVPHTEARVNMVVTSTPFGTDVEFHMGSAAGNVLLGQGHLDAADVTLTTDYVTAIEVFVTGNPAAGMQAFMAGKVKVQGDMAKLMASQAAGPPRSPEMQTAIQDVTAVPE